ncbi:flippase [Patescibacteria group bacterium]|nr:flippase [Patescibacteria group bacterium]
MVSAQKITANTSFFMTALILQKVLSFVYFTLLARALGVGATGQYFFAISFATMFAVISDLGMSPLLIRETAKENNDTKRWFDQIFTFKLLLALVTVIVIYFLDTIIFYNDAVRNLIYLTTAIIVIDSFTLFFYAYIRGKQSLKWESWGTIIFQVIVIVMGLSLLQFTTDVFILLTVLLTASLFNMIYSFLILLNKFHVKPAIYFDKGLAKKIIKVALPFALAAIFAKIYAYMDTFLLKIYLGDEEVGFYSIAYKITFALQFIPLAFVAALYPAFTDFFKNDQAKLRQVFSKAFNYLAFISLPISFGIIALAHQIVPYLYTSEFSFSVFPLQVLIASIPFLFINFSLSSFLNASGREKTNTRNLGLVMAFNVILNLFFIPRFGIWGASLASTMSTVLLFSLNLFIVAHIAQLKWRYFLPILGSFLSSLIMYFVVIYLKDFMSWYFTIVLGALVYIVIMFTTKTMSQADIMSLKKSFFKTS